MPRRTPKPCTTPGCPNLTPTGRCPECRAAAENRRQSGAAKYGTRHRTAFRPAVLAKNAGRCIDCDAPATIADHSPRDRDELQRLGLDPDDPQYGEPRCKPCHDRRTALTKPAGFRR